MSERRTDCCKWKADSRDEEQIREITAFTRRHRKERLRLSCKTTLLLAATGTKTSMFLMHLLNTLYVRLKPEMFTAECGEENGASELQRREGDKE